ncbi:4Fe-4S dicluster domain-containing protein [Desulfoluna spongiiphila]|uniref:4Fe-4S dicluster domain-containing protein n=1 Tax=Desulfoluna spongiiphila TaxID=419481 RepID=UPI00125FC24A|nr:4Fe-4S dicluster domain-containing protein [Desulfoluna spongiiphila]
MMKTLTLTNGFSLNTSGQVAECVAESPVPTTVALMPGWIPHVKPRLLVKEGDAVNGGAPLFEDKRNPVVTYPSPGGGVVERIVYGPRRRIDEVVITLDEEERWERFEPVSPNRIAATDPDTLRHMLLKGGVWPLLRELPFRDHPDPASRPAHIIVTLGWAGGHLALPALALEGEEMAFQNGLAILKQFCPSVHVITPAHTGELSEPILKTVTAHIRGGYPAGDPGHYLYHIRKEPSENRSWYIEGQDLVALARFVTEGSFYPKRVMAVGGNGATVCGHVRTRVGAPVSSLDPQEKRRRRIGGSPFSGLFLPATGYMNFFDKGLTLLPVGDEEDLFGFLRAGYTRPSQSRTFLSVFNKKPLNLDCGMHGEGRPCINCGRCAQVCPVAILPQYTMKCMVAGEVEEALAHGLLDCIECGLCSYVCPSKIELLDTLKTAKAQYRKERDG